MQVKLRPSNGFFTILLEFEEFDPKEFDPNIWNLTLYSYLEAADRPRAPFGFNHFAPTFLHTYDVIDHFF